MYDTVANINAMKPDAIIIRHSECGLPESLIGYVDCPIINAGDGRHSHPTQAFLDLFTIYEYFDGETEGKKLLLLEMLEIQGLQEVIEDYFLDLE